MQIFETDEEDPNDTGNNNDSFEEIEDDTD